MCITNYYQLKVVHHFHQPTAVHCWTYPLPRHTTERGLWFFALCHHRPFTQVVLPFGQRTPNTAFDKTRSPLQNTLTPGVIGSAIWPAHCHFKLSNVFFDESKISNKNVIPSNATLTVNSIFFVFRRLFVKRRLLLWHFYNIEVLKYLDTKYIFLYSRYCKYILFALVCKKLAWN